MSIITVEADQSLDAWRAGAEILCETRGAAHNLLTIIKAPCEGSIKRIINNVSPNKFSPDGNDIRDVINTIFPISVAERTSSRSELYDRYLKIHDRARLLNRRRRSWGTYFERLIRFPPSGINQLERVIEKLRDWKCRSTAAFVFHLSAPDIDAPTPRGGPCWQYGELLWNSDDTIDFVSIYRNHDFFNKVLGNFIGLSQLLGFICNHTGKKPGALICHSVHAYYECSKRTMQDMIS